MKQTTRARLGLGLAMLTGSSLAAAEQMPTPAEMWKIIQQQQREIETLKQGQQRNSEKAEATAEIIEQQASGTAAGGSGAGRNTQIGGYGEMHYNDLDSKEEIDFHRFVLFFGHQFTDRLRFFSEVELEHALSGDGENGEVELEQAYIEYDMAANQHVKAGLFLLPVGILNETHEPPAFYGVERNDVENILIPSTWWEAGAGIGGGFPSGLSWDLAVHSGLAIPTEGSSAFRVRSGRQKVAEAFASDPAYTLRLKYIGIPGLELAASYQYQSDPSQFAGDGLDRGRLLTAHAIYHRGDFGLRALYAGWQFEGNAVEVADADNQSGWYIEPSYLINEKWGVYFRYEDIDATRGQDKFTQNEFGFNYWPTDGVVLKVDYRQRDFSLPGLADNDFDALDLGFGYSF